MIDDKKQGYCDECEKRVAADLYNGSCDPHVFVCSECAQFIEVDKNE